MDREIIEIPFSDVIKAKRVIGGHINMITQRIELEVVR